MQRNLKEEKEEEVKLHKEVLEEEARTKKEHKRAKAARRMAMLLGAVVVFMMLGNAGLTAGVIFLSKETSVDGEEAMLLPPETANASARRPCLLSLSLH